MRCPKCGRENTPGAPFCADCGKDLFAKDEQPVAVVVEQQVIAEETPAPEPEDAMPTPVISDGAIFFAPVTDDEPASKATAEPEPEPIPDPEPASKFIEAFDNPPTPEPEPAVEPAEEPEAAEEPESKDAAKPESQPSFQAVMPAAPAPKAAAPTPVPPAPKPAAAPQPEPEPEPEQSTASQPEPAPEPKPVPEPAPAPDQPPAPDTEPQFAPFASTPIVPPNPARPHQTYPQPGGETLYKKGCLAAAWDDITESKGWFGKILLLGLVYCVPILNFFVMGYAMRWSRELFLGKVEHMPERIFGNRMFVNGFFAFVIQLVIGIVVSVCGFVLDFIPIVGGICYFALAFLVSAFEYLAIMRAAVADRLGAGFDVSQLWNTGKRNFGALCCATVVPSLIMGAIMFVIVLAVTLIMGLPLIGVIAEVGYYGSSYYPSVSAILSILGLMIPMLLVIYIVTCFLSAFMMVLVMRATGHFVARYAQDWKGEQAVMSTAYINGL